MTPRAGNSFWKCRREESNLPQRPCSTATLSVVCWRFPTVASRTGTLVNPTDGVGLPQKWVTCVMAATISAIAGGTAGEAGNGGQVGEHCFAVLVLGDVLDRPEGLVGPAGY